MVLFWHIYGGRDADQRGRSGGRSARGAMGGFKSENRVSGMGHIVLVLHLVAEMQNNEEEPGQECSKGNGGVQ